MSSFERSHADPEEDQADCHSLNLRQNRKVSPKLPIDDLLIWMIVVFTVNVKRGKYSLISALKEKFLVCKLD